MTPSPTPQPIPAEAPGDRPCICEELVDDACGDETGREDETGCEDETLCRGGADAALLVGELVSLGEVDIWWTSWNRGAKAVKVLIVVANSTPVVMTRGTVM